MFTYSHANTPLSQSERVYYLSYFLYKSHIYELWGEELYASWLAQISSQLQTQLSNPIHAWNFFRLSFRNCKSCVYNCDDLLSYKQYPVNKPELKNWEIIDLSSSSNLHSVKISRAIGLSVFLQSSMQGFPFWKSRSQLKTPYHSVFPLGKEIRHGNDSNFRETPCLFVFIYDRGTGAQQIGDW